jgi:low temperature requirement protein LtrA
MPGGKCNTAARRCLCVHVCVCVCVYVCVCVCVKVQFGGQWAHLCMNKLTRKHILFLTCAHLHIQTYTHTHAHTHKHARTHKHTNPEIYAHLYSSWCVTVMATHTHTQRHTHTHMPPPQLLVCNSCGLYFNRNKCFKQSAGQRVYVCVFLCVCKFMCVCVCMFICVCVCVCQRGCWW